MIRTVLVACVVLSAVLSQPRDAVAVTRGMCTALQLG